MVNQQSKFLSHLAEQTKPLRDLLSKKNQWTLGHDQQQAFERLKGALSSGPLQCQERNDSPQMPHHMYIHAIVNNLPASEERLRVIREQQDKDPVCKQLKSYCLDGKAEWKGHSRAELTVAEGLLLCGSRMVIPSGMRVEILEKIHSGHQGMTKCQQRAKDSVWWPGMRKDIDE